MPPEHSSGMRRSAGLMVNYVYRLDEVERNHEAYAKDGRRYVVDEVADGDDLVLAHEEERVGASYSRERVDDPIFERDVGRARDEVDEDLGVGR